MLSQIGYISLPVELVEKLYYGKRLTPEERMLADGRASRCAKLLGHIPRLEPSWKFWQQVSHQTR